MECEMCGRDGTVTDIGDFNGVVCCYDCAKQDPELWGWVERENRRLGFGLQKQGDENAEQV